MKKVLFVGLFSFAFIGATQANNVAVETQLEVAQDSVKRTLVEAANLPAGVRTVLTGDDYQGWTVETAYLVEEVNKTPYYEISLRKEGEEEARVLKMDAEGNIID